MSGSPWIGVMAIGGFAVGSLFLIFLMLRADRFRQALGEAFRVPLIVGLLLAGGVASILTLRGGVGGEIGLTLALGIGLINLSDAARPRWLGWLMLLDGAVLLGVVCWSFAFRSEIFESLIWRSIFAAMMIAGSLWSISGGLLRFIRPRADHPHSTDQTPSETETPA